MKQILAAAVLVLSQGAFADCITLESAQKVLRRHLEVKGEADFPKFFAGKSIPQKVSLINELVAKTTLVEYEDYDDLNKISGYSILIEKFVDHWGRYSETYLFAQCDGQVEKQEFNQD